MKKSTTLNVYLWVSSTVLGAVGALTTFNPIATKADAGIDLAGNASALNDVRAFGMLLLVTGILGFTGALGLSNKKTILLFHTLMFLAIAAGRVFSIIADGLPFEGMIAATGVELVLGFVGLILYRKTQS